MDAWYIYIVMAIIVLCCLVKMWNCVVFILCTFATLVQCNEAWREVNIAQGPVRGRLDPDGGLYVFYNIPYATAPTGADRFKAPLPPPVFLSPFDAVDRGIICPQPIVSMTSMNMREDCLVANVFVPDTVERTEPHVPVLVVIHGGAYQYGYGLQEQFKELAKTKKVIVVTFNYRLGVHGFLCLGTEGAPGNAGLKDQVALLRWVNTNIENFGGDPGDVTLAGCRAGAGSIDFLTLSSITKGLFKQAIMESGVSTGAVGVQINPIKNAKYYANLLDFKDVDDLSKLEEFYKTTSFERLTLRHEAITNNQDGAIRFGPCVEPDIGQERVVFNAPFNILKQGNYTKIPLMYGFTNTDGEIRLPFFEIWKKEMNEEFSDFLPLELHFDSKDDKEKVAQEVKQFYFESKPVDQDNIQTYITYFTDILFGYPMLRSLTTRVEALEDTIYLFEYSFVDEDKRDVGDNDPPGRCQQFLAVMDEDETEKSEAYKHMKHVMREYWHSFIFTGVPSSFDEDLKPWSPANAKRSPHMFLGNIIELKDDIMKKRADFWDTIYEKYYRGPLMSPTSDATTTTTSAPTTSDQTPSPTTFVPTTSAPTTTIPSTEGPGGAVSLVISNVMFAIVSLSLYLNF